MTAPASGLRVAELAEAVRPDPGRRPLLRASRSAAATRADSDRVSGLSRACHRSAPVHFRALTASACGCARSAICSPSGTPECAPVNRPSSCCGVARPISTRKWRVLPPCVSSWRRWSTPCQRPTARHRPPAPGARLQEGRDHHDGAESVLLLRGAGLPARDLRLRLLIESTCLPSAPAATLRVRIHHMSGLLPAR